MEVKPVITQYLMDGDLERSTYRVSMKGSEYLFLVEETESYTVDYRENFSTPELDPRYFRENRPESFNIGKDIEKIFSELLNREKQRSTSAEAYSLSESTI